MRNVTAPARRRLFGQQGPCARWPVAMTMAGLMLSGLPLAVAANDPPGLTLTPLFNASTQQDDAATHSLEEQDPTWMNLVDAGMALRFDAPASGVYPLSFFTLRTVNKNGLGNIGKAALSNADIP